MTLETFDDVLRKGGVFGLYQKRILFIACVTSGAVVMHNMSPVFTMKMPHHRCKIPGLENDTYEIQNPQHALLVNASIPQDVNGDYVTCTVYDVTLENKSDSEVACDEWVYDKSVFKSTYVTELNLVCDRKQYRSHSTMMIFPGKFLGAFLNSIGGDYFGRRRMYLIMVLGMTATGVGLMFVPNILTLMVLRFLMGATTTGAYLPAYVIPLEMQGPSYRRMTGTLLTTMGTIMTLLGGLCAFLLRDWRSYQACLLSPFTVILVGYFFIPESPRWLVSKGRLDEAQKIIDAMAKTNGVSVAPKLSSAMFEKVDNSQNSGVKVTPLQLFRIPRLLIRYSLLYLSWSLISMGEYGLSYNVTNMSGDIFLNYSLSVGVKLLSLLLFFFLIERIGRRAFLLVSIGTGGVVCLASILPTVLGGSDWVFRGLSFFGKMCVSAGHSANYVMSPELFPTVLRSFGLGSCSMMSRFGALASPYIADLNTYVSGVWGPALPQMVFGVAGLLTAVMIFFLPETRGRNLPETVRDAELFGRIPNEDLAFNTEVEIIPKSKNEETEMLTSNESKHHTN